MRKLGGRVLVNKPRLFPAEGLPGQQRAPSADGCATGHEIRLRPLATDHCPLLCPLPIVPDVPPRIRAQQLAAPHPRCAEPIRRSLAATNESPMRGPPNVGAPAPFSRFRRNLPQAFHFGAPRAFWRERGNGCRQTSNRVTVLRSGGGWGPHRHCLSWVDFCYSSDRRTLSPVWRGWPSAPTTPSGGANSRHPTEGYVATVL